MKHYVKTLLTIFVGNTLLAFGICAFVVPCDFMLGGANGIALIIQNWLPLRLSVISGVVNVFFFLWGWFVLGWKFAATSLISTIIYSPIMAVLEELHVDQMFGTDPMIGSIYAAALIGIGVGLVIRVGASTGGMDIPSCILQKYKKIPVGTSMMVFDTLIILCQMIYQGVDGILYAILIVVISTTFVNKTIVAGERKVEIFIISPAFETIRQVLLEELDTGVTLLDIETGYQGEKQKAVFSVVYSKKYPKIRETVLAIDEKAFIVSADVMEVNGRGYTISRT